MATSIPRTHTSTLTNVVHLCALLLTAWFVYVHGPSLAAQPFLSDMAATTKNLGSAFIAEPLGVSVEAKTITTTQADYSSVGTSAPDPTATKRQYYLKRP